MLKEILKEISQSDYISKPNIAIKLNRSEGLVEDAFIQLTRMGYIKEDEQALSNCETSCGGCPFAKTCNKLPVKTITITDKGRKLLEK